MNGGLICLLGGGGQEVKRCKVRGKLVFWTLRGKQEDGTEYSGKIPNYAPERGWPCFGGGVGWKIRVNPLQLPFSNGKRKEGWTGGAKKDRNISPPEHYCRGRRRFIFQRIDRKKAKDG